jgi:Protein of unknown function (DUF2975)
LFYDKHVKQNRIEPMIAVSPDRARLKRIARYGEWICVAALLLLCSYCLFLALQPEEALAVLQRGLPGTLTRPSDTAIYLAALVAFLPVMAFLYALWLTRKLFRLIGGGHFLETSSQNLMARIGKLAIIFTILSMLCHTIVALLLTSANPPGEKIVLLEIDSGHISSVLIAVLFFTFSLLMKESAAIHEDNQSII